MRNEIPSVDPSFRHRIKDRFKVTLLRPPHKTDGVVVASFLVVRVVATGPVRARHLERQLLLVEVVARELQSCYTDQYDASAGAAHLCRVAHRLTAGGGGGYENSVNAATAGDIVGRRHRILNV